MNDHDVTDLLERAAGPGDLPVNFTESVIARARSRRRRRAGAAVGALAAVILAGGALLPQIDLNSGDRAPNGDVAASAVDPAVVKKLNDDHYEPIAADQIITAETAGDETIVVVHGVPHAAEAAAGGKRARIFVSHGGGKFYRASDYLSYDYACYEDDAVCKATRPSGLGLYLVRPQADGRTFAVVVAPHGRQVEVVAKGRTYQVGDAADGAVVELPGAGPRLDIDVWVTLPDGERYRIFESPGSTVRTQPEN